MLKDTVSTSLYGKVVPFGYFNCYFTCTNCTKMIDAHWFACRLCLIHGYSYLYKYSYKF